MTERVDVALATAQRLSEPDLDLAPLERRLFAAGLSCKVLAWDDPAAGFDAARMTLLRSTWNYPLAPNRFMAWIDRTAEASDLWNRPEVVRWNLHKRYLLDLAEAGIPVAPTELVAQGSAPGLRELVDARGWSSVVVKPAVSASSMNTLRFERSELGLGQAHLRMLADQGDVLVQQYLSSVESHGERALIWVDGKITHAVRKAPRFLGDDEATSRERVRIAARETELASRALEVAQSRLAPPLLYARVDLAPGANGEPVVMELELIEPSLYFEQGPAALDRLVEAVKRRLGRKREFSS